MKIPKQHWAIQGCSTWTAKKHLPPFIDGKLYTWTAYFTIVEQWKKLKPGHLIWNPYTASWSKIKEIHSYSSRIWGFKKVKKSRRVVGHYIEFSLLTEDNYILYDIDQWFYNFFVGIPIELRESFFEKLAQFNTQFGEGPYWTGPFFEKFFSREDWETAMDQI